MSTDTAQSAPRATLLIVDDQPINIQAMYQALKHDYQLLMATSGAQAVELCLSSSPDLVLLDVVMPEMDGYAVCAHLKAEQATRHIPIIFMTGGVAAQDESQCLAAGAIDFITKPVNPAVLKARVSTHITLKLQTDQLRQRSEELVAAQRLGKVGSWTWDVATAHCSVSAQLSNMLCLEGRHTLTDLGEVKRKLVGGSWKRFLKAIALAQAGRSSIDMELAYLRSDATLGCVLCNVEPVINRAGQVQSILGTVLDITERSRLEQLRLAKDTAELASQHKTRFLSSMSHELRTPLNAILGFSQLLALSPSVQCEARALDKIKHITNAGQHLLAMVEDILDLSSIESGHIGLSMGAIDVSDIARECLAMTDAQAQSRQLAVSMVCDASMSLAHADRRRMRQILLNLLSNAIKYNRVGGGVMVRISGHEEAVSVAVGDTGPGLSTQQQSQLFEPFNRLGAERSATPGSGIGLALSHHLASAMGGHIAVESSPGEGSVFTLSLRRASPV